ncbi:MAG: hypothetical protein MMC23_002966 [Stictis urceolatum]|nr:hypothetical protein [Stictis urceolata]
MELIERTIAPAVVSTKAPTAPATAASSPTPTSTAPTVVFNTPALTTIFTPPVGCGSQRLTMLQTDLWKVWMNEILPVPNTTFTSCYPKEYATSYLQSKSGTLAPAFSPLVCPHNYRTVFNQTFTDRPLYIACCPTSFGFTPPEISTPGRPAFGGTCYSNISSTTVTQYDNSSSSGVTLFTTMGQAYAHPIDGFALHAAATTYANDVTLATNSDTAIFTGNFIETGSISTASASTPATATASSLPSSTGASPGIITGSVLGGVAFALLLLALLLFYRRGQNLKQQLELQRHNNFYTVPCNPHSQPSPYPPDEKHLPPTPPYQQSYAVTGSGTKLSEMNSGMTWVQELPGVHAAPQELAVTYSPRSTTVGSRSGKSTPHIITAARTRSYEGEIGMCNPSRALSSYHSSPGASPPGSPPRAYWPHRDREYEREGSVRSGEWPQPPSSAGIISPERERYRSQMENPFGSPLASPGFRSGRGTPARKGSRDEVLSPLSSIGRRGSVGSEGRGSGRSRGGGRSEGGAVLSPISPEERRFGW